MGSFPARAALLLGGVVISACAYGLTVRAQLGLGPLFLVQRGLEGHLGLSAGNAATVLGFTFVVICLVLRTGIGVGTLVVPLVNGRVIDAVLPHVPELDGAAVRVVATSVGASVLMLGAVLIARAGFGMQPIDGVMHGLSLRLGSRHGTVRLGMELTMVAIGAVAGSAPGLGTVIAAVIVGRSYEMWDSLLGRFSRQRLPTEAARVVEWGTWAPPLVPSPASPPASSSAAPSRSPVAQEVHGERPVCRCSPSVR